MERLRELREERGYTQSELARLLDIDRTAIAKYEAGANGAKSEVLLKMADLFGVSTDYLLGRSDTKKAPTLSEGERDAMENEAIELLRGLQGQQRQTALALLRAYAASEESGEAAHH